LPFYIVSVFSGLIPLLYTAASSNDEYLPFSYDPSDEYGPGSWHEIAMDRSDPSTFGPWGKYVGWQHVNLKITGNACSSDRRPSPVNLVPNVECTADHEILTHAPTNEDCGFGDMLFVPTPHALVAKFPHNDVRCRRPQIDFPDGYPNWWTAALMEFHVRSEHTIDGRRYDGEMIMYHHGTFSNKRELAAVSVLLDASGDEIDLRFQAYLEAFREAVERVRSNCDAGVEYVDPDPNWLDDFQEMSDNYTTEHQRQRGRGLGEDDEGGLDFREARLQMDASLLDEQLRRTADAAAGRKSTPRPRPFPYDIWPSIYWYRYLGGLTQPPCTEMVLWTVLDSPLVISRGQLRTLAALIDSYVDPKTCQRVDATVKGENVRPLGKFNAAEQNMTHCTAKNYGYWRYKD